jgi:uncharacterized protein
VCGHVHQGARIAPPQPEREFAMTIAIEIDRGRIAEFCRKWRITEFCLFGSVLRDDFRPDSDVDVMVSFAPETHVGLRELDEMNLELRDIFGREVDFVERKAVEQSRNYIRRRQILATLERIYAAG